MCELLFCRIEAALWNVGSRVVFCSWVVWFGESVAKLLVILSPWFVVRLMWKLFWLLFCGVDKSFFWGLFV